MLTLNVSCSGLHCTESSPPADNRPPGTEHDTQLLVHLAQELPVLADRSSTFPEGYVAAYQNKFIWFALTNKASLETAVRVSGIRSNETRWLTISGQIFSHVGQSAPHIHSFCHLQEHPVNFWGKYKYVFMVLRSSSTFFQLFLHFTPFHFSTLYHQGFIHLLSLFIMLSFSCLSPGTILQLLMLFISSALFHSTKCQMSHFSAFSPKTFLI